MIIYIISDGKVVPYINHPEFDQFVIPSEVDTVNLTWEAGHETVRFNHFLYFVLIYEANKMYFPFKETRNVGYQKITKSAPSIND